MSCLAPDAAVIGGARVGSGSKGAAVLQSNQHLLNESCSQQETSEDLHRSKVCTRDNIMRYIRYMNYHSSKILLKAATNIYTKHTSVFDSD